MKVVVATLVVGLGLGLGVNAQVPVGAISGVTWRPGPDIGTIQFTVTGRNPCGAVHIEFSDGTDGITYAIERLPATVTREFTRVGTFGIRARGMGNCEGAATTEIRVLRVRPQPQTAPPPPPPQTAGTRPAIRFANMDTNRDGVITREEWRGSARSFEVHDWNRDGRLAGNEVEIGATWPPRSGNPANFNDWSRDRFTWLDTNGDNRISRSEWRYDVEDFFRVDRDGDNFLSLREFLVGDEDDDRGDRFEDLDLNRDGRIDRDEWHGSAATFTWLDRNGDNLLTRAEVAGTGAIERPTRGGTSGAQVAPRTIVVTAREAWHDTGIDVRPGDLITVSPSGQIQFSAARGDVAPPAGASGQATPAAPRPGQPIGALLGRIGTNGEPFLVGRSLDSMRADRAGRLYLGVNDDRLDDNSGQFRAVVSVIRR